jgi:hypothetical protein
MGPWTFAPIVRVFIFCNLEPVRLLEILAGSRDRSGHGGTAENGEMSEMPEMALVRRSSAGAEVESVHIVGMGEWGNAGTEMAEWGNVRDT